jgi:branched-chain amino acid transport system ATP-binding protein
VKASPLSASRRAANWIDHRLGGPAVQRLPPRKKPPLLELRDVDAAYGPFRALFGVTLTIEDGSATALLGSNGSGKTTVARVASGLIPPTEGHVLFDGQDVTGFASWELTRMGICHVPEGRSIFSSLTVDENLLLTFRQLLGREGAGRALAQAYDMFPVLADRRHSVAGTLSGGQQRMLALARAFPDPPRLLIADELSLGLAPLVVDEVFESLAGLAATGTALLIVEQHVERAVALADRAILLQKGRVVYSGATADMGEALEQVLPTVVSD